MNRFVPLQWMRWLAPVALVLAPAAVVAASGEFTFVVGDVALAKRSGQRVAPAKGTPVDPGDVVTTGANGMAQLSMVDNARLSLRPNTQFAIEAYPQARDSTDGALLNLVKGTLRTFTGLIASSSREKFVMKTRVATVGIRGSGNILYACEGRDCDASVAGENRGTEPITVNHTIEGAHAVTNVPLGVAPGTPPQQGGALTLITGPGQTVIVQGGQPPRYIPTPSFISDAAVNMAGPAKAAESTTAAAGSAEPTRNFSPSDTPALPSTQTTTGPIVGQQVFPPVDATINVGSDPIGLHDIIIAIGSPFSGQATREDVDLVGNEFRGYRSYAGTQSGVQPSLSGGTQRESNVIPIGSGGAIAFGRVENGSLGFFGPGTGTAMPGSIHWIVAPSGYPVYLSDVLTGTSVYTLVGNTAPTNQHGIAGGLGSGTLNVNFSNRSLGLSLTLTVPAGAGNAGGNWTMSAENVPFSLNSFYTSTGDQLVVTNGGGVSSRSNQNLTGSVEGSFVGNGLTGAILGYGIADQTSSNPANHSFITGVAGFSGTGQNGAAGYREGRVSDPAGTLAEFIRTYAATDRPDEVVSDTQGRVTSFTAPYAGIGSHATYSIGTAQVVQSGADPETGLVWGRWGGGVAQARSGNESQSIFLNNASLHYIFAGTQNGPVSLPLTGTAVYDIIGSTTPTGFDGHTGTLNSASLSANFSARTVDASVNVGINGQTWNGVATNVPIYRDQYFSAYSGTPIAGVPNPAPLFISCQPNCGQGASGSIDGFFAGRTGQRAGMMYNLGGNQGAIAFGRRGGG